MVNTGWTGGPYGEGKRMKLAYTRAMIRAALTGQLDDAPTVTDPIFGLQIPTTCPDVPSEVLQPEKTWKSPEAYRAKSLQLAERFVKNAEDFASDTPEAVRNAGPKVPIPK